MTALVLAVQLLSAVPAPAEPVDDEPYLRLAPVMLGGAGVVAIASGLALLVHASSVKSLAMAGGMQPSPLLGTLGMAITVVGGGIIGAALLWGIARLAAATSSE